jgi:hypothetical protein
VASGPEPPAAVGQQLHKAPSQKRLGRNCAIRYFANKRAAARATLFGKPAFGPLQGDCGLLRRKKANG